jgi:hypothetical protein
MNDVRNVISEMIPSKLQWLQDPRKINMKHLNNVRRKASGYIGRKRGNI